MKRFEIEQQLREAFPDASENAVKILAATTGPLIDVAVDTVMAENKLKSAQTVLADFVEFYTVIARTSYSLWRDGEWVLTDEMWREVDPDGFALIEAARNVLGPQADRERK